MRKMILIAAATLLLSPVAHAGGSRSLSLSRDDTSADVASRATDGRRAADASLAAPAPVAAVPATQAAAVPVAATQVVAVTTPAQAAPVTTATTAPEMRQPDSPAPSRRKRAGRASRSEGNRWTKNRIISELHRHGIYW